MEKVKTGTDMIRAPDPEILQVSKHLHFGHFSYATPLSDLGMVILLLNCNTVQTKGSQKS